MKNIFFLIILGFSTLTKAQNTGFLDFNGYYDTRSNSVMTLNILANLENRFQYFSLTNYWGQSPSSDLESFYSEHNVRWRIRDTTSIDLTIQYVMRQGFRNDDWRLGFRWRTSDFKPLQKTFKKLNFKYSINPMLLQFREASDLKLFTQIEHVYRLNIAPKKLNKRLYIGGFWDQSMAQVDGKTKFNHVTEHQLGARIIGQLYAVAEYRVNTFLPTDNTGLGYGFEYKIVF
jgi:hypothetical protein